MPYVPNSCLKKMMILNNSDMGIHFHAKPFLFISSSICFPIKDGDFDTTIPAYYKAFIFDGASPLPFWTIAPA